MTLALTMGITIGVKNTMKMMVGELIGVLIVAGTAVVGGGAIISSFPIAFAVFKYGGGLYLMFVGYQMINSRGSLALNGCDITAYFMSGMLKPDWVCHVWLHASDNHNFWNTER